MKLQKRITVPFITCADKRRQRRMFRQVVKESGVWPETYELALNAARKWGR